jgi:hypothetical protein
MENKNPRPKGRGIGIPGTGEGTPQAAGNLPAIIKNGYTCGFLLLVYSILH